MHTVARAFQSPAYRRVEAGALGPSGSRFQVGILMACASIAALLEVTPAMHAVISGPTSALTGGEICFSEFDENMTTRSLLH